MSKQSFCKAFKLLEFIRNNTDEEHPAAQDKLRKMMGEKNSEIMGDKGTYARRLKELADAYNTDSDGNVLPQEEWRICYPGYGADNGSRNGKVFYRHPVSGEELSYIINCIRRTHNFTLNEKSSLENRVRNALGSSFFRGPEEYEGCVVRDLDDETTDQTETEEKIKHLRSFIKKGMMTDITVFGSPKENVPVETAVYQVSPYRIVKKDAKFWLIANWHERPAETYPYPGGRNFYSKRGRTFPWYTDMLTAFRIDLISDISGARVPDATMIHWCMNPINLNVQKPKERKNAGSLRKARIRNDMKEQLKRFDEHAAELIFEHCVDIKLKN